MSDADDLRDAAGACRHGRWLRHPDLLDAAGWEELADRIDRLADSFYRGEWVRQASALEGVSAQEEP